MISGLTAGERRRVAATEGGPGGRRRPRACPTENVTPFTGFPLTHRTTQPGAAGSQCKNSSPRP
jgi:hypothetical protein